MQQRPFYPLSPSTASIVNRYCQNQEVRQQVTGTLASYTMPDSTTGKVRWVVYRLFNAIKSLFGASDWQLSRSRWIELRGGSTSSDGDQRANAEYVDYIMKALLELNQIQQPQAARQAATTIRNNLHTMDQRGSQGVGRLTTPTRNQALFPNLEHVLNNNRSSLLPQKRAVMWQACDRFQQSNLTRNLSVKLFTREELADFRCFENGRNRRPRSIQNRFERTPINVTSTRDFYDYTAGDDVYVDFANRKLGGGIFGRGMVQEEVFGCQSPEFMEYVAQNLDANGNCRVLTRQGEENPGRGNPTPVLMKDLWVVQEDRSPTRSRVYGRGIGNLDSASACREFQPCNPPRQTTVLAMAAPNLAARGRRGSNPLGSVVGTDLFNSALAGFSLAKKEMNNANLTIHTGRWGAGVFGNNPIMVYLMQRIAAEQVGVNLVFHGYRPEELATGDRIYDSCLRRIRQPITCEELIELVCEELQRQQPRSRR